MKSYVGTRSIDGIIVTVDGDPLQPRRDLVDYSPNGFEWSYEGPEPTQLAFALLYDHLASAPEAKALAAPFMRGIVANLDNDWLLTSEDVEEAIAALRGREDTRT